MFYTPVIISFRVCYIASQTDLYLYSNAQRYGAGFLCFADELLMSLKKNYIEAISGHVAGPRTLFATSRSFN